MYLVYFVVLLFCGRIFVIYIMEFFVFLVKFLYGISFVFFYVRYFINIGLYIGLFKLFIYFCSMW